MQKKQKRNWIVGAVLFGGFLLALWLDLTGVQVHQWLGVALAVLATYHLAVHWRWVIAVTERLFGRTSQQARTFYAVDAGLAAGFLAIVASGLVISSWLDLSLANYAAWRNVHVVASVATLALVVAKIGLHWRWIVTTGRRHIVPAPAQAAQETEPKPVAATAQAGRRDFLRLMAGVGVVALVGGANALGGLAESQVEASTAEQAGEDTPELSAATAPGSSSACTVRCQRRCSYPGHCRRYTDSNGNGRCDYGECLS